MSSLTLSLSASGNGVFMLKKRLPSGRGDFAFSLMNAIHLTPATPTEGATGMRSRAISLTVCLVFTCALLAGCTTESARKYRTADEYLTVIGRDSDRFINRHTCDNLTLLEERVGPLGLSEARVYEYDSCLHTVGIGKIVSIDIVLDEEETARDNFGIKYYDITIIDDGENTYTTGVSSFDGLGITKKSSKDGLTFDIAEPTIYDYFPLDR
jgi:hypothetical protein